MMWIEKITECFKTRKISMVKIFRFLGTCQTSATLFNKIKEQKARDIENGEMAF